MNERASISVTIGGLGGQGALFFGKLLCGVAAEQFENVLFLPNYIGTMRGGETSCNVLVSDEEILSPFDARIQSAIAMSQPSAIEYEKRTLPGGMLMFDSSVVKNAPSREDLNIIGIPATQMAIDLGDVRAANLIFLGAFLEHTGALPVQAIADGLDKLQAGDPSKTKSSVNKEALHLGARFIANRGRSN